jgi:hypothetical protein
MPSNQLKDGKLTELVQMVRGWGRLAARQAYGPEGPSLDLDLAGMEKLATELQGALLEGLCEELTQGQAERLPETQPCPDCGCECEVQSADTSRKAGKPVEHRRMQLRGGGFTLKEPWCHCKPCRRHFFPDAPGAAD